MSATNANSGISHRPLGHTDIKVSDLCLGTMTWGSQTDEADAHAQIDMALSAGINFIDTAELYPVTPSSPDTYGGTEKILGTWLAKNASRRGEVVVATKVAGAGVPYIRGGTPSTGKTIKVALDDSLARLQTDYVDLYQLHWPNRGGYMFRYNWQFDPTSQDTKATADNMLEILTALGECVKAGKIRAVGLSNESCWGTLRWLQLAEAHGLPRMASVQNEYSLMHRLYDTDMAEMSHHEQVGLLAYSPLATGLLTGKYADGKPAPKNSRMSIVPDLWGRINPKMWEAVTAYAKLAKAHNLDMAQMALAWIRQRSFTTSVILGATVKDQLAHDLAAVEVTLNDEVVKAIDGVNFAHPLPY